MAWAAVAVAASGCHTAVGRYFADRGRDLSECVRVEMGGAVGVGVVVEAAGVVHAGLGGGMHPAWGALGWSYGAPVVFVGTVPPAIRRGEVVAPLRPPATESPWVLHTRSAGPHESVHGCWLLLPALFGESVAVTGAGVSRAAMWSRRALADPTVTHAEGDTLDGITVDRAHLRAAHRWNHVHAFDCSVDVYAGVVHVGVGVSPGEVLDFILGWFGLDIAGDDQPRSPPDR